MSESIKDKITIHCDVPIKGILTLQTVESVYEVPSILEKQGLGDLIFNHMRIQANKTDMHDWNKMVDLIKKPKPSMMYANSCLFTQTNLRILLLWLDQFCRPYNR